LGLRVIGDDKNTVERCPVMANPEGFFPEQTDAKG
jgi:hypothetical protein